MKVTNYSQNNSPGSSMPIQPGQKRGTDYPQERLWHAAMQELSNTSVRVRPYMIPCIAEKKPDFLLRYSDSIQIYFFFFYFKSFYDSF